MTKPNQKAAAAKKVAALSKADVTGHKAAAEQPRSRETCTVACKVPAGLRLQLYKREPFSEPVLGGGTRESSRAVRVAGPVIIAGPATPFGAAPRTQIIGGYALTHNVDAEFMRQWLKDNADHEAVVNKMIFVQSNRDRAESEATELADQRSGMEPMHQDPSKDPRRPRSNTPNLDGVTRAEQPAAAMA